MPFPSCVFISFTPFPLGGDNYVNSHTHQRLEKDYMIEGSKSSAFIHSLFCVKYVILDGVTSTHTPILRMERSTELKALLLLQYTAIILINHPFIIITQALRLHLFKTLFLPLIHLFCFPSYPSNQIRKGRKAR